MACSGIAQFGWRGLFWRAGLCRAILASRAQDTPLDPHSSIAIDLPADSPVTLVSADMGESRASARGGAMYLDLHMSLKLRNNRPQRILGMMMIVSAQEAVPGGRGYVARWMDVAAGEVFPLQIDIPLLRPLQPQSGALVHVNPDGILFSDFSFYGPDRFDSKRTMMVWAMEAQRDRQQFKSVHCPSRGPDAFADGAGCLDSLNRQAEGSTAGCARYLEAGGRHPGRGWGIGEAGAVCVSANPGFTGATAGRVGEAGGERGQGAAY